MKVETVEKSGGELSFWPSPQDYNEAVQHPQTAFADPELRASVAVTGAMGIPRPISGGFASVYNLRGSSKNFAVRCFLNRIDDQQQRYELISEFLASHPSKYTVDFQYLEKGILVHGTWFPVLKMEWVQGETLDRFIEKNLYRADEIFVSLAEQFQNLCSDLRERGAAHGDLQHGNIIVTPELELKLVDYDGMFVPRMIKLGSTEDGHRNYQHPSRGSGYFGGDLDVFSECVIDSSLRILAVEPSLYAKLSADDSLLFKAADFADPLTSKRFYLLENHGDYEVRRQARLLRWQCTRSITELSRPTELPAEAPELPELILPLVPVGGAGGVELGTVETDEEPAYYDCPWWRMFSSRPHWQEGIQPALLRPGRKIRLKPLFWPVVGGKTPATWILFLPPATMLWFFTLWFGPGAALSTMLFLGFLGGLVAGFALLLYALTVLMLTVQRLNQYWAFSCGRPSRGRVAWVTELSKGKFSIGVGFNVADENCCVSRVVSDLVVYSQDMTGRMLKEDDEVDVLYLSEKPSSIVLADFGQFEVVTDVPPKVVPLSEEADLWWRYLFAEPALTAGIEPKLLRPFRSGIRSKQPGGALNHAKLALTLSLFLPMATGITVFLVMLLLCASVVGLSLYYDHQARKLCQSGRLARAQVLEVVKHRVSLSYTILDDKGMKQEVFSTVSVYEHQEEFIKPGEVVTILYNADTPQLPVIYRFAPYEVV